MKNLLLILTMLLLSEISFASPEVPIGSWSFQNRYIVNSLRMAETVPAPDKKPTARVKKLRDKGFLCIHKSPTVYLCTKIVKDVQLSKEQEKFVIERFQGFQMDFAPTQNQPKVTFDGSTQTDYLMAQDVKVAGTKYSRYGITVMNSGEVYFKFVSDSEGPSFVMSQFEESFGLPMILQTKVNSQTWGYYLNVLFDLNHQ